METKLQYFDIYLHNKNILEYALLLVGSGRFMIFHIESHSSTYFLYVFEYQYIDLMNHQLRMYIFFLIRYECPKTLREQWNGILA